MKKFVSYFEASRFCRTTILVAAMVSFFSACSKKEVNPEVLAKVGKREITISDFKQEVEWRKQNERPVPNKEILLGEMISRELTLQKAKALGLEKDFDVQRTYEDILASKLREGELATRVASVKVSPEEIHADYKKNLQRYTQPAKARLAMIYIKTDRKMSQEKITEQENRMGDVSKLAKALPENSKGFDSIAVDFSDDQSSRYKGGDVGWFDKGASLYRWPTEVIQSGFALKTGELSSIIKTADGFYLIKKTDARDTVVMPYEQVQGTIRHRLLAQKRQEAEAVYARELQTFAPVETNEQALAGIDFPKTTVANAPEFKPPALPRSQ